MRRSTILGTLALVAAPCIAQAAVVEPRPETFASRWTGAWIVTGQPMTSECNGIYTNNQVAGGRVFGRGHQRFEAGVVGRVDQVLVSSSRVTLSITLSERLYVTRPMREFTLTDTASCQVDLKFMVPPGMGSEGDLIALENLVSPVVERHAGEGQAILASGFLPWDGPEAAMAQREAIAAHRDWKAAENRQAVDARMAAWSAQTARLSSTIENDPDYLAGFARGVEEGKNAAVKSCEELARMAPAPYWPAASNAAQAAKGGRQKAWARGYQDGVRLTQGLEAMKLIPACSGAADATAGNSAR
ncbi:MAG TPA: hypothetical protein VJV75_08575 [Candidatus Polarisedimenticolia bacterium]|nr:hypothetical protein [Candidatus Polarisedimenticolia bacterium]